MSNLPTETTIEITADEIFSAVNFDVAENDTVYNIENNELIELEKGVFRVPQFKENEKVNHEFIK